MIWLMLLFSFFSASAIWQWCCCPTLKKSGRSTLIQEDEPRHPCEFVTRIFKRVRSQGLQDQFELQVQRRAAEQEAFGAGGITTLQNKGSQIKALPATPDKCASPQSEPRSEGAIVVTHSDVESKSESDGSTASLESVSLSDDEGRSGNVSRGMSSDSSWVDLQEAKR